MAFGANRKDAMMWMGAGGARRIQEIDDDKADAKTLRH
jgi:hypothetical protein